MKALWFGPLLTLSSLQQKEIFITCVVSAFPFLAYSAYKVCLPAQYLLRYFFPKVLTKFESLYTILWQYAVTVTEPPPFPLKIWLQLSSVIHLSICNFVTCEPLSILDSYEFNCFHL